MFDSFQENLEHGVSRPQNVKWCQSLTDLDWTLQKPHLYPCWLLQLYCIVPSSTPKMFVTSSSAHFPYLWPMRVLQLNRAWHTDSNAPNISSCQPEPIPPDATEDIPQVAGCTKLLDPDSPLNAHFRLTCTYLDNSQHVPMIWCHSAHLPLGLDQGAHHGIKLYDTPHGCIQTHWTIWWYWLWIQLRVPHYQTPSLWLLVTNC
jgi:hypothetical protein